VQLLAQAVGLFAGLAAVIYIAGAIVLVLRLVQAHLAWANVVPELPRQAVLSIGVGEVLLPALVIGGAYAIARMMIKGSKKPEVPGWRHGRHVEVLKLYARAFCIVAAPFTIVLAFGYVFNGFHHGIEYIVFCYLALLGLAITVHEGRSAILRSRRVSRRLQWDDVGFIVLMVTFVVLAAMPSIVFAASVVPLPEAKVCMTGDRYFFGYLVGETSESVFIGQPPAAGQTRYIAILPQDNLESVIVGKNANELSCLRPLKKGFGSPSGRGAGHGAESRKVH
jgi:hypothetical protein